MDRINVRTVNNGGSRMLATVVAALLLAIATTMPFASTQTLAQVATDTPTPEPTISPQQQCVDGGGVWSHDSCHHLQEIAINPQIVTACGVADEHTGRVTCSVGLSGDLPPNYPALQNAVSIAPGCLSINRSPYPRLMVGLGSPTIAIGPAPVASGSAQVSLHNPIFMAPGYPVSGNRQGLVQHLDRCLHDHGPGRDHDDSGWQLVRHTLRLCQRKPGRCRQRLVCGGQLLSEYPKPIGPPVVCDG